jgi:hypothetical protein
MSKLERLLGELAGSASLCWEPRPTGVFDSTEAQKFVADCKLAILEVVRAEINDLKKEVPQTLNNEDGWSRFEVMKYNLGLDDINSKIGGL